MSNPAPKHEVTNLENVGDDNADEVEVKVHIHAKTIIAVLAVCSILFVQLMSVVGAGSLGRDMATSLGSPTLSAWFPSSITILTLATILPVSQAADYWGRKNFILGATTLGLVGAIMVSRAQNIATAIAGMVFVGSAYGCQSICYAIPSEVLNRKYRAYGQAAANVSSGIGGMSGVLIGGALVRTDVQNWRIFWYVAAALFAIGLVGIFFGYNPPKRELEVTMGPREKLGHMDWIGSFLIAAGLVLLVIALQYSGNPYTWRDGHVLGPFISGVLCLAAFGAWEWKGTKSGILDHRLFFGRDFPLAIMAMFVEGLAFFAVTNYFVYELVILHRMDSFTASLRFAVVFIISIVVAFAVGVYTTFTKRIREPLIAGFLSLMSFSILMVFYHPGLPLANSYGYGTVVGTGLGLVLSNLMVAAHMGTPPDMISMSSGLLTAVRSLGGTVGLAINNSIFNNSLKTQIPNRVASAVLPLGFSPQNLGPLIGALSSQSEAAVLAVPGVTAQIAGAAGAALQEAFKVSFSKIWIAAAVFSSVGVICSCFISNPKSQFTEHIDAPVELEVAFAQEAAEKRRYEDA
ncbi:putative siderophore iron transporter [Didymella exigua CBS 183.55]|uniref:Putative siderophore iron transporter n=1 Tax=Didymella exigua CBS 183.55 TaxID=1150837 RepID=A0A6A5R874_9PLEO|nr:putative siderophore iron transporter [Didymella exigua CBS 183.55]KAF1923174.1 putative siderophore iron transporter [Didymella exigua CBS 183.55]